MIHQSHPVNLVNPVQKGFSSFSYVIVFVKTCLSSCLDRPFAVGWVASQPPDTLHIGPVGYTMAARVCKEQCSLDQGTTDYPRSGWR